MSIYYLSQNGGYALRSKPPKGDLPWSQLKIREIETFYP